MTGLAGIWRRGFATSYVLGLVLVACDLVGRLLGSGVETLSAVFQSTLGDFVVVAIAATVIGALSPAISWLWLALAPLRATLVRWGTKLPWGWLVFLLGALYFLLPLIATFHFSISIRRDHLSWDAYANVFADGRFQETFTYSLVVGLCAIVVGILIVVPAAYYVRLRAPQLRPIIEFVTLLPLIIPPIILVFGYIRLYNSSSILPLTNSDFGTNALLTLAYVALALPYMYRAVDTGLRTIDVQTLTEAANILGANQATIIARVIFPNIIVAVLSGAFLTLAIVIGEFTMASLLNRQAFGVYMQNIGANRAFEPAALAVVSFILTWGAMGMIQLLARFAPKTAARV